MVMEGGTPGHLLWLYVDARDTVGHYLEYCWMTPERWAAMGGTGARGQRDDASDSTNKVVVITGAAGGMGHGLRAAFRRSRALR